MIFCDAMYYQNQKIFSNNSQKSANILGCHINLSQKTSLIENIFTFKQQDCTFTYISQAFQYMFFTPLYGVRNTGCPQISTKICFPN
jgi:hypothetical protein